MELYANIHNPLFDWIKYLLAHTTNYVFTDPSMTVRADISGRYSNRLYAYEPNDGKLCKQHTKSFTQICPLPAVLAFIKNRLITLKCSPPLPQCWAIWRRLRSSWSLSCEWEDERLSSSSQTCCPYSLHTESQALGSFCFSPSLQVSSHWIAFLIITFVICTVHPECLLNKYGIVHKYKMNNLPLCHISRLSKKSIFFYFCTFATVKCFN